MNACRIGVCTEGAGHGAAAVPDGTRRRLRPGRVSSRLAAAALAGVLATLALAGCGGTAPASHTAAAGGARPATGSSGGSPAAQASGGSTAAPSAASLFTLQGPNRLKTIEQAARQEGSLSLYTTQNGPMSVKIRAAFLKQYPFLKMTFYRAAENDIVTRTVQEASAGRHSVDVFELALDGVLELRSLGLLTPYYTPTATSIPATYHYGDQGHLVWGLTDRISFAALSYNTHLIPQATVPHSLNDLLSPSFKGKMAIATSTTGIRWLGGVLHVQGKTAGTKYLARLKQQNVHREAISGSALTGMVAQGQMAVALGGFQATTVQYQHKGAPIAWAPMPPVVADVDDVVMPLHPAHPAAALLFADWLLGPKGQALLKQNGYAVPTAHIGFPFWIPETGLTASSYQAEAKQWKADFNRTFGG